MHALCESMMDGEIAIYIGIKESIENVKRFAQIMFDEMSNELDTLNECNIFEYIVSRHYRFDCCFVNRIDGQSVIDACKRSYLDGNGIEEHTIGWFLRGYNQIVETHDCDFMDVF